MATLRKIDGSWTIDWRDPGGRRHRKALGRVADLPERDARRILKQKNLELTTGFGLLNPPRVQTFGQFAPDYLLWHAAEFPASHYRIKQIVEQHLLPEFEYIALDAFNPRDVDAWKHSRLAPREDRPKAETVGKELRTLKAMLAKAVEWNVIARHPIPHVAAPLALDSKPPRFFTAQELQQIYAACGISVNGARAEPLHAAIWRLYANTGLRRNEGLILRRAWIGREAMKILSSNEARTKSGKWREIPLTNGALAALEQLPRDDYVLPRVHPASLSRACIHDIRRAGLDGSLHTLRHTYISHLVMAGVPLRTIQTLAGHSTIAVTERYAHLTPEHLMLAGRSISL